MPDTQKRNRNLGVRAKILLVGAIGLIGAIVLSFVTVGAVNRLRDGAREIHDASHVVEAALALESEVNMLNGAQNEYLLSAIEVGAKAATEADPHRKTYLDIDARVVKHLAEFPPLQTEQGRAALATVKE